jgi:hypothetical protein
VIVKTSRGYQVRSEGGRNLSKDGLSLEQARKRLAMVEWFKARKGHKGRHPKLRRQGS